MRQRVVVLDDEEFVRGCHKLILDDWFGDVTMVEFEDGDSAWYELSRQDPGLFITDVMHPGLHSSMPRVGGIGGANSADH